MGKASEWSATRPSIDAVTERMEFEMPTFQKTGQTVSTATYMHFPTDSNPVTVGLRAQPKTTKVRGKSYTVATRLYSQRTATGCLS